MEKETPKPQGAPVVRARIIQDNEKNVWGDYVAFYLGIVNPKGQTHYALPVQFDPEPDNRHGETLLVCHKCPEGRAFMQSLFEDLWDMGLRPGVPDTRLAEPTPVLVRDARPEFTRITQNKSLRQRLDAILQELKTATMPHVPADTAKHDPYRDTVRPNPLFTGGGRHRSVSITHLEDAIMRLGMDCKEVNASLPPDQREPSPYPQSYNPANAHVEPTADRLKL